MVCCHRLSLSLQTQNVLELDYCEKTWVGSCISHTGARRIGCFSRQVWVDWNYFSNFGSLLHTHWHLALISFRICVASIFIVIPNPFKIFSIIFHVKWHPTLYTANWRIMWNRPTQPTNVIT